MNPQAIENNKRIYKRWEHLIDDPKGWYGSVDHFRCVRCGRYCTYNNFRFVGKYPDKVLCYNCQAKVDRH